MLRRKQSGASAIAQSRQLPEATRREAALGGWTAAGTAHEARNLLVGACRVQSLRGSSVQGAQRAETQPRHEVIAIHVGVDEGIVASTGTQKEWARRFFQRPRGGLPRVGPGVLT